MSQPSYVPQIPSQTIDLDLAPLKNREYTVPPEVLEGSGGPASSRFCGLKPNGHSGAGFPVIGDQGMTILMRTVVALFAAFAVVSVAPAAAETPSPAGAKVTSSI